MTGATNSFGFFNNGVSDGIHISQRGKSSWASGTQWQSFKLDLKGEEDNTRTACDKMWDIMPSLEGQGAGESSQPVALRSAGYAGALQALQIWATYR